ncbi:MAG: zinc ABC transporter solute-binding protein [Magnetococcales bacterium]|nr:zinc ABC transporter solute-binding protein [Magnetococcales bacterium]
MRSARSGSWRRRWLAIWLFTGMLTPGSALALEVVVSIKPLHALVAFVMQGVGSPDLLLPGTVSEHTYALRPSDARMLSRAGLIFWGGAHLEGFLVRTLANVATKAEKVALLEVKEVTRLPMRSGGVWEEEEGHHDHDHGHGKDPHAWLDPRNAMAMGQAIAAALARLDPERAERYHANALELSKRLQQLDQELADMLQPWQKVPYIVFHDAYQYFEQRYGMNAVGSFLVDPERPPTARRVAAIVQRMQQTQAVCLFTEPQYSQRLTANVTSGHTIRTGVLDPLGAGLPAGPDLYFGLLKGLAHALAGCLRG